MTEKTACEEPPLVENGTATLHSRAYYNGDKVTYDCQSGYDLRGPKEIICERGTWTRPPECVGRCAALAWIADRVKIPIRVLSPIT